MQASQGATASTPHEKLVHNSFLPRIAAALNKLKEPPADPEDEKELLGKLNDLNAIRKDLAAAAAGPHLDLRVFAPALLHVPQAACLPVPGTHEGMRSVLVL